jgi:hypothetical protein
MSRLSSVLTTADLPLAELCAASLDGHVFRLDGCFEPVDLPHTRVQRASVIGSLWPGKFIAERSTAAWIWGAQELRPAHHELCVSLGARARPASSTGVTVREVVIDNDEFVIEGGTRVTTPLRTLIDIARFAALGDETVFEKLAALARIGSVTRAQCSRALDRRRNVPYKTIAWQRVLELNLPER